MFIKKADLPVLMWWPKCVVFFIRKKSDILERLIRTRREYCLCGLGSGIILAVLVLMIANKITPEASGNNKDIHETTGSVIAYTTQADVKGTAASDNAVTTAAGTIAATQKTTEGQTTAPKEKVTVHISSVTVASDIARMLAENGIIDNADAFVEYLYSKDYSRVIQEGDFELIKGDTYENIAKIITRQ